MDWGEILGNINFLAVAVAALSSFVIGWLWYGPLFGNIWMKLNGFTPEKIKEGGLSMPVIMGINYIATFLAAIAIAMFFGNKGALFGICGGITITIFWIATNRLNDVLYERKPWGLFLINVGYNFVTYVIMGAIIGAWQ